MLHFISMDCLKICCMFNLKDQIFWLFKMKMKMPSFWKNYTVLVILYKRFGWTFCLLQTVSLGKNTTACKNLGWVLVIFQKNISNNHFSKHFCLLRFSSLICACLWCCKTSEFFCSGYQFSEYSICIHACKCPFFLLKGTLQTAFCVLTAYDVLKSFKKKK